MVAERRRDLEERIIIILGQENVLHNEDGLRWTEIKNSVFMDVIDENPKTIGTKLQRALKRLQRDDIIIKNSKKHKLTFYKLSNKGRKIFENSLYKHINKYFPKSISEIQLLFPEIFKNDENLNFEEFESKILSKIYRFWRSIIPEIWGEYNKRHNQNLDHKTY